MYVIVPKTPRFLLTMLTVLMFFSQGKAQTTASDSTLQEATLDRVVQYALTHQPLVQQAEIDQKITDKVIKGKLADWYPQLNFTYNYQRFIDLQSSVIGGNVIRFGVNNTSSAQFSATQALFNRDVLLASSTASNVRIQSEQSASKVRIDLAVNVTKAFYDLLATAQQIKVSQESVTRLERSLKDAYSRYQAGLSDKTDYKRATILLGNAQASLKTNSELFVYKEQYLKMLMGYPSGKALPVRYDTLQMEQEIVLDTTEALNPASHIDYKLLVTQRELQDANVRYSYWAFLPTLNLFGSYNLNFQNNNFGELYNKRYPYSFVGVTLGVPIFQGGKRTAKIQEQRWASKRLDASMTNLQNSLTTEYTRALASYKSNLANYLIQRENVALAQDVYNVVELQYRSGIKTYLDVTVAESDLRTTRINYFNALYQVLASKIDVQKALGQIN